MTQTVRYNIEDVFLLISLNFYVLDITIVKVPTNYDVTVRKFLFKKPEFVFQPLGLISILALLGVQMWADKDDIVQTLHHSVGIEIKTLHILFRNIARLHVRILQPADIICKTSIFHHHTLELRKFGFISFHSKDDNTLRL